MRDGDNVVWQVDTVDQYRPLVRAFSEESLRRGRRVVYFRFATHEPLLEEKEGLQILCLRPADGFEVFVSLIHAEIVSGGRETVCVFDCLSELAADWCSDRMLGNFYMLICPYVYDHSGAAYFSLLRNRHSFHATDPVRRTTQILADLYSYDGKTYLYPQKVLYRHTSTMFSLHVQSATHFVPVTTSSEIAEIFAHKRWNRLDSENWRQGYWSSLFARAEDAASAVERGEAPGEDVEAMSRQLCRMLIGRSGPVLAMAEEHLELTDLLAIRRRMIGTGLVGGKSVGLILAQAVLRKASPDWHTILEPTDSFFIGADVFYTFLVENGLWWIKQHQKDPDHYRINLLQCRPFLTQAVGQAPAALAATPLEHCIVRSAGPVIGQSREIGIDRIIYVVPRAYGQLPIKDRYTVARLIGTLMKHERSKNCRMLLLGPGRWGTSDPSLGVPSTFSELYGAAAISEIASMHEGLVPDLSLGSHFFHELVEMGLLYLAIFPEKEGYRTDDAFIDQTENRLTELVPEAKPWIDVVRVLEPSRCAPPQEWTLLADTMQQLALLKREA